MYLDAIESNYSHEQMTPLNCILTTSKIALKRVIELMKLVQQENSTRNLETIQMLQNINQSGQLMFYYNSNQIERMKIEKSEFRPKPEMSSQIESFIIQVLEQFEP